METNDCFPGVMMGNPQAMQLQPGQAGNIPQPQVQFVGQQQVQTVGGAVAGPMPGMQLAQQGVMAPGQMPVQQHMMQVRSDRVSLRCPG